MTDTGTGSPRVITQEMLDESFMDEVREARENGYDQVCAECGTGLAGDDMEMHVRGCSRFEEVR